MMISKKRHNVKTIKQKLINRSPYNYLMYFQFNPEGKTMLSVHLNGQCRYLPVTIRYTTKDKFRSSDMAVLYMPWAYWVKKIMSRSTIKVNKKIIQTEDLYLVVAKRNDLDAPVACHMGCFGSKTYSRHLISIGYPGIAPTLFTSRTMAEKAISKTIRFIKRSKLGKERAWQYNYIPLKIKDIISQL